MKKLQFLIYIPLLLMVACSNEEGENLQGSNKQSHILKTQVQALKKAKGVEQMLQKGADNRRLAIEEQTK